MARASKATKEPEKPITVVHTLVIKFTEDAIKKALTDAAFKALPAGVRPEAFIPGEIQFRFTGEDDDIELSGASVAFEQAAERGDVIEDA